MRFRGLISDQNAMKEFMNTINALSKLSKECVLRILPDKIYFIINEEDHGPRKPFVWCELSAGYFFREYNMHGVSEELNEIFLSFHPALLAKPLTSIKQGAKSLKIKLTNKHTPCLTLEIDMVDKSRMEDCVHDFPVEIITKKYWGDYKEPTYEEFHVSVQLPSIKPVRNIVDRMKTMSHYLILCANRSGRLTLKIEANLVNVSAHFHNLIVQSFAEGFDSNTLADMTCMEDDGSQCHVVSVSVDVRKFVSFLSAFHFTSSSIVCSIVHDSMTQLSIHSGDHLALHCFLSEYKP